MALPENVGTSDDIWKATQEARLKVLEKKIDSVEASLIYLVRRQSENDKEFLPLLRALVKKHVKADGSIKLF